jgi:hypothetical protein
MNLLLEARAYGRIGTARTIALTFLITAPWWAISLMGILEAWNWARTGVDFDIAQLFRFSLLLPVSAIAYAGLRWFGRKDD